MFNTLSIRMSIDQHLLKRYISKIWQKKYKNSEKKEPIVQV